MQKQKTERFEVLIVGKWRTVRAGEVQPSGWLHYELADGTIGLTPPKKWRKKP